jgi:hypothetical protein
MESALLSPAKIAVMQVRYDQLKAEIATLGWISQGSVTPNGAAWRWTRKVNAKTVTVALSEPQAELFKSAIADHRRLENIITEMRALSQKILLESVPGPRRRGTPKSS